MSFLHQLDASVLLFIQDYLRCAVLTPVMIFFSAAGSAGLIWITAGALMLLFKKTRYCGAVLLLCLGLTWVLNDGILKPMVQRLRPYQIVPELQALLPLRHDYSFPSGHTATSFACACAVRRILGRRWTYVYVLAALIAFSRLYLGMHYPIDVLGGILVGTFSAWAICALADRFLKPRFNSGQTNKKQG